MPYFLPVLARIPSFLENKLGAEAVVKNGVSYAVSAAKNVVSLKLAVAPGEMKIGNAKANKLKGTADSDIFYGGKGKDKITGVNGRDVAVYRAADAWGKDTIAATKGTMTLVLGGLTAKKVTRSLNKDTGVMTITKKADTSQKITVKGWSAATHSIVYATAAELKPFATYINAASPTDAQKQAAQNSVFKAAKLA